jgi:CTP synthase
MVLAGVSPDDRLVEIIELPDHPFFVASQFHPEFTSRPDDPHPLFIGLIEAAKAHRKVAASSRAEIEERIPERT